MLHRREKDEIHETGQKWNIKGTLCQYGTHAIVHYWYFIACKIIILHTFARNYEI